MESKLIFNASEVALKHPLFGTRLIPGPAPLGDGYSRLAKFYAECTESARIAGLSDAQGRPACLGEGIAEKSKCFRDSQYQKVLGNNSLAALCRTEPSCMSQAKELRLESEDNILKLCQGEKPIYKSKNDIQCLLKYSGGLTEDDAFNLCTGGYKLTRCLSYPEISQLNNKDRIEYCETITSKGQMSCIRFANDLADGSIQTLEQHLLCSQNESELAHSSLTTR